MKVQKFGVQIQTPFQKFFVEVWFCIQYPLSEIVRFFPVFSFIPADSFYELEESLLVQRVGGIWKIVHPLEKCVLDGLFYLV